MFCGKMAHGTKMTFMNIIYNCISRSIKNKLVLKMFSKFLSPKKIMGFLKSTKGFDRVLEKVNILTLENGKCTAEFKVEEEHTNPYGGLHGGISATIVDSISSCALISHPKCQGTVNVSLDIHMTYLKGAKVNDEILVEARTLRTGNTMAFLEVELRNKATGDILIKGAHTKYIFSK